MNFVQRIEVLRKELLALPNRELELNKFIQKCHLLTNEYFPTDIKIISQLESINTKPKGSYFPEMSSIIKEEALKRCKNSLIAFLETVSIEYDRYIIDKPIEEILKHEESQYLEFKSTLCWDVRRSRVNKKLMGEIIMKSISAFSNSDGGILLIGVADNGKVLGLSNDYKIFKNGAGNRDDFELHLTTLLINNFTKTFAKDNIIVEFPTIGKKEICVIRIKRGQTPYTTKITNKDGQIKEKFFIRINNSSREIDSLLEFAKFIKKRFPHWN